ncbi:MAG TPA: N-acetylmuramoyl-L-alanine amidase [Azospirillaceae bacterium]|nr:N-acetylmuramoyl-L-alanine amidase [Azospirillaceae bacterium]
MRRRELLGLGVGGVLVAPAFRPWAALADPRPRTKPGGTPGGKGAPKRLVVIDPGHGGRDPGAVGIRGTREKDVVLDIARAIATALEGHPGVAVRLTRTGDEFLALDERREIASELGATLFVSIHADSAPSKEARGLSAYTLSDTASDELAKAVAEQENRSDRFATGPRVPARVAAILRDFALHETLNRSIRAKSRIVDGAARDLRLLDNPKRAADFAVLRAPDVPSVLVETGFLSNRDDETRLADPRERKRIAAVLAREIGGFVAGLDGA